MFNPSSNRIDVTKVYVQYKNRRVVINDPCKKHTCSQQNASKTKPPQTQTYPSTWGSLIHLYQPGHTNSYLQVQNEADDKKRKGIEPD